MAAPAPTLAPARRESLAPGALAAASRPARALARPSATGTTVLAVGIAGLVLGWALGYPVLSVIGLGALVAVVLAWASLYRAPALEVERELASLRVERGTPAHGVLTVRNPSLRRSRPCTAFEPAGLRVVRVDLPPLGAGEQATTPYRLPTSRRGPLPIGPLVLVRSDPFGLCEVRQAVGEAETLWVRPRVLAIPPLPGRRDRHIDGPTSDAAPQGSTTFHTLRDYVAGDDLRKVHWRTSARVGTLMVRQLTDTSLPSTVVLLDLRASVYDADGERFEEAVDMAASVVTASLAHGFPVRFVTTEGTVRAAGAGHLARGSQRQQIIDYLAEVEATPTDGTGGIPDGLVKGRSADNLVVVTGVLDPADRGRISAIGRSYGSTVVASIGSPEEHPFGRWPGVTLLEAPTAEDVATRWGMGRLGRAA